jgi:hypothetical protein
MVTGLEALAEFEKFHGVRVPDSWTRGREILAATLACRLSFQHRIAGAPESLLQTEPTFGILVHLTERAYEQLGGAFVCFASKSAAASEVAARVALETSMTVRFISGGDRASRTLAWIRHYVEHDAKQIREWAKVTEALPPGEKRVHESSIAARRRVHETRRRILEQLEAEFASVRPVDLTTEWPTIAGRFAAIGEALAYRTAYARLSSQTHADAEDSINYMVARVTGEQMVRQMSEETIAFSEYLVYFAVHFYVLALRDVCVALDLAPPSEVVLTDGLATQRMLEIAKGWGW